jgi:hypothetical protein
MIFQVIGDLQPSWTYCLYKTLSGFVLGLVTQLFTSLAADLKI